MNNKEELLVSLEINSRSWLKETDDLFDFESYNMTKKLYTLTNEDKENFIISYKEGEQEKIDIVTSRHLKEKLYNFKPTKIIGVLKYMNSNSNFKVINSFKSKRMKVLYKPQDCERIWELLSKEDFSIINEGDIIKLGRIRIKFDKINLKETINGDNNKNEFINDGSLRKVEQDDNNNSVRDGDSCDNYNDILASKNNNSLTEEKKYMKNIEDKINIDYCCRLCYQNESSISDPLISPCKCNGSMKYIHLSCLKRSISSKIQKRHEGHCDFYLFKGYNCEICLSNYPKYITYKNMVYPLVDIDIDSSNFNNYVQCSLSQYVDNNHKIMNLGYLIFYIHENNQLTIGRKQNNQIKLKDISISRNHCEIIRKGQNILLRDLDSKFGTMKYIKDFYEININEQVKLLSGKHEFDFYLKKRSKFFSFSWFSFGCCSCNQSSKDKGEVLINVENKYNQKKKISEGFQINNTSPRNDSINCDYYSRFKDCDSYNDYIIQLDYIIGVTEEIFDTNNNKKNNQNEILEMDQNNKIKNKEKEESGTNY